MAARSGGCAPTGDGDSLTLAVKAASRVNALLIAKGDLNPSHLSKESVKNISTAPHKNVFDAEVEINDAPLICRNILTRNSKQEEISKKTGAFITTKGRYVTANQRLYGQSSKDRPLYLYIQAETEANVQRAVSEINQVISSHGGAVNQTRGSTISLSTSGHSLQPPTGEFISQSMPSLTANMSQQPSALLQHPVSENNAISALAAQMQFLTDKAYIGLEHAPPSFNVRGKVAGSGGSFLQHIHSTSGAVVTLRGRGSGYLDPNTTKESTEPMHIHLQHVTEQGLAHARELAADLIKTVQNAYSEFQQQLALQPPALPVNSATHMIGPGGSLIPQSVMSPPGMVTLQPSEQPVMSSHGTVSVAPPISVVMSQQPPSRLLAYNHQPATYVQSTQQTLPMTAVSGTMSNAAVGYNSLSMTKHIEIVPNHSLPPQHLVMTESGMLPVVSSEQMIPLAPTGLVAVPTTIEIGPQSVSHPISIQPQAIMAVPPPHDSVVPMTVAYSIAHSASSVTPHLQSSAPVTVSLAVPMSSMDPAVVHTQSDLVLKSAGDTLTMALVPSQVEPPSQLVVMEQQTQGPPPEAPTVQLSVNEFGQPVGPAQVVIQQSSQGDFSHINHITSSNQQLPSGTLVRPSGIRPTGQLPHPPSTIAHEPLQYTPNDPLPYSSAGPQYVSAEPRPQLYTIAGNPLPTSQVYTVAPAMPPPLSAPTNLMEIELKPPPHHLQLAGKT